MSAPTLPVRGSRRGKEPARGTRQGTAYFVGAGGIALLDAGESLLSGGFHDTATEVSKSYTRGDISWNEGNKILAGAALRAIVVAAITRGVGTATSRIGAGASRALRLATGSEASGAVSGLVAGGLDSAVSLGVQAGLTSVTEALFRSPEARAIWAKGIPTGKDWAIAIPLGMLLGARSELKNVRVANQELIGKVVPTPSGPMKVVAVTPDGTVVLKPVGAGLTPPPPRAPLPDIVMVYDAQSGVWKPQGSLAATHPSGAGEPGSIVPSSSPKSPGTALAPSTAPKALPPGPSANARPLLPGKAPSGNAGAAPAGKKPQKLLPEKSSAFKEPATDQEAAQHGVEGALDALDDPQWQSDGKMLDDLTTYDNRKAAFAAEKAKNPNLRSRPGKTPEGEDVNPKPALQYAHSAPQAALRDLSGYDPGEMIVRGLPTGKGHPHNIFDQYWQSKCRDILKTGRTEMSAHELHDILVEAATQSGAFTPEEAKSVVGLIVNDLYFQMALKPTDMVRVPGAKK